MGWDYSSAWQTRAQARDAAVSDIERSGGTKVVDMAWAKSGAWLVCERDKARFAVLVLVSRSQGDYGYKVVPETMGPYYWDIPRKLFGQLTALPSEVSSEASVQWRSLVRRELGI